MPLPGGAARRAPASRPRCTARRSRLPQGGRRRLPAPRHGLHRDPVGGDGPGLVVRALPGEFPSLPEVGVQYGKQVAFMGLDVPAATTTATPSASSGSSRCPPAQRRPPWVHPRSRGGEHGEAAEDRRFYPTPRGAGRLSTKAATRAGRARRRREARRDRRLTARPVRQPGADAGRVPGRARAALRRLLRRAGRARGRRDRRPRPRGAARRGRPRRSRDRHLPDAVEDGIGKLGRMAVARGARRGGIGTRPARRGRGGGGRGRGVARTSRPRSTPSGSTRPTAPHRRRPLPGRGIEHVRMERALR